MLFSTWLKLNFVATRVDFWCIKSAHFCVDLAGKNTGQIDAKMSTFILHENRLRWHKHASQLDPSYQLLFGNLVNIIGYQQIGPFTKILLRVAELRNSIKTWPKFPEGKAYFHDFLQARANENRFFFQKSYHNRANNIPNPSFGVALIKWDVCEQYALFDVAETQFRCH